jgi:hypothetical protein
VNSNNVGQTWVKALGKYVDTKAFDTIYSNKGIHVVPVDDRRTPTDD